MPDLDFSGIFGEALSTIERSSDNFYVTGNAGTGKSTLLRRLVATTAKHCVVLAPTGVAAVNVDGQTIHSFFWFPTHLIKRSDVKSLPAGKRGLIAHLDMVVVDEASMVRADLMDAIDVSLRKNRKIDRPFGGVQMVMFGDLYQLPPVVREAELRAHFEHKYGSPYFFSADVFRESPLKVLELKHIFRQADPEFIALLNRVRNDAVTPEDLGALNALVRPSSNGGMEGEVLLTATNDTAERFNRQKLAALRSESFSYPATVWGDFDENSFPTDESLEIKAGARVMMIRNDREGRWVNGTVGTVSYCDRGTIRVRMPGGEWEVRQEEWSKTKYVYDEMDGEIEPVPVGTFIQYPIKLAWAVTIHKSQGKTFERIAVDLGRGAFAHGQVYVALSRCRTLEGIRLVSPIRASDVMVDGRVSDFGGGMNET